VKRESRAIEEKEEEEEEEGRGGEGDRCDTEREGMRRRSPLKSARSTSSARPIKLETED